MKGIILLAFLIVIFFFQSHAGSEAKNLTKKITKLEAEVKSHLKQDNTVPEGKIEALAKLKNRLEELKKSDK